MEFKKNIVGREKGLFNSILGESNQHIIAGVLLRLGFAVATSPVRTGAYDLIVTAYVDRENQPYEERLLRVQTKTMQDSLKLIGGTISKSKIQLLKNNFDILLNWRDNYLNQLFSAFDH